MREESALRRHMWTGCFLKASINRLDQIEAAFEALGKRLKIEVRDAV